jgi:hypothetical protein
MNTRVVHTGKWIALIALLSGGLFLQSCDKSKVSATGGSIYANPDSIQFSPEHYAAMLQRAYLDFYNLPPASTVNAIENAADNTAAKKAYEDAIDEFVDSGIMKKGWLDYCFTILGVGSSTGGNTVNMPCNLFAYVILQNKPMSEFILADYGIDNAGNQISSDYTNGPPAEAKAGYITMDSFVDMYMNSFQFKMLREVIYGNLCMTAPFTRFKLYGWSESQVNVKYRESGGIKCSNCHAGGDANGGFNSLRYAFHNFNGNSGTWQTTNTRSNNYYDMELGAGGADEPSNEPRDASDMPVDAATAEATMYKLTEDGEIVSTPRILASEISKHPGFIECWAERLITRILNADPGHPGQNAVAPNYFGETAAQKAYLTKWTAVFNEDKKPKSFIKAFLKSGDYLILGYQAE